MADKWKKMEASPTWDFRKNPILIGTFIDVEEEVGPNKSKLYNFRKEDGSLIAVWGNTVLDNRFRALEKGTKIKIEYMGAVESETRKGSSYHNFEVYLAVKDIPIIEDDPGEA